MNRSLPAFAVAVSCLISAVSVHAQPSGAHPRTFVTPTVVSAWQAMQNDASSPVGRAITRCTNAHDNPADHADGQYQGFAWVEALSACLVAYETTSSATHRDTAITYLMALLNDRDTVGDGLGPAYNGGVGIVSQDTGYSMRTHGVFAALGYDWLHGSLTTQQRTTAHTRFTQWLAFHQDPNTYQRDNPGANYHAGHVLAVTLIAIAHADEMNTAQAGSGTTLWNYVVDTMWGDVMANGYASRGLLQGGDWLEGWQYGPLSVASYSLAGRAMVERGVTISWLDDWNADVFTRYVHGLTPADRSFVGGDSDDDFPSLDTNPLPLWGVVLGNTNESIRENARAELTRLHSANPGDFSILHEALAAANTGASTPIVRTTYPRSFLAAGSGNFYARTRHDATAAWLVSQCRGIAVDHQHSDAGNVVISRGEDELLVDPSPYGSLSTLTGNAPTMNQPHFDSGYQPSQGAFGEWWGGTQVPANEATRFTRVGSSTSGVHATRCDYTGQFRFRDVPSDILSSAERDVVALPGANGMTTLIVDRVRTTADYASNPNPLLLRFRSLENWAVSGDEAQTLVGASKLRVRRVVGQASMSRTAIADADCTGDRGKCRTGRFPSDELGVSAPGPNPYLIHALDVDVASDDSPPIVVDTAGVVHLVDVHRETRDYMVVSSSDASVVTTYEVDDTPRTHVVLDPPAGAHVRVATQKSGARCVVTLTSDPAGFAVDPLVFSTDGECVATADSPVPPPVPQPDPQPPFPPTPTSNGGCGCHVADGSTSNIGISGWLVGIAVAFWRRSARKR